MFFDAAFVKEVSVACMFQHELNRRMRVAWGAKFEKGRPLEEWDDTTTCYARFYKVFQENLRDCKYDTLLNMLSGDMVNNLTVFPHADRWIDRILDQAAKYREVCTLCVCVSGIFANLLF